MDCALSLTGRKNQSIFILKFYLYMRKSDFSCLAVEVPAIMELRFLSFFSWCCTLTWVMKILMWAISNVHTGRIRPVGHRCPAPDLDKSRNYLWSVLPDENFNKMPNNAIKRPEKGQTDCLRPEKSQTLFAVLPCLCRKKHLNYKHIKIFFLGN